VHAPASPLVQTHDDCNGFQASRPTAADRARRARRQHAAAVRAVAIASPAEGSGTTMRLRPPLSLAFVK
jgi:hypothetical protein